MFMLIVAAADVLTNCSKNALYFICISCLTSFDLNADKKVTSEKTEIVFLPFRYHRCYLSAYHSVTLALNLV